jgi:type IV pilus assembly protein PilE
MKLKPMGGFTLLELMIALVVVGIISAVALPSYTDYLKRTARTEAKTVLLENVLGMEQAFTVNNTYIANPQTVLFPSSPKSGKAKYILSVDTVTATTFKLKAVPVDTKDKCGTFFIDHTGQRSLSVNDPALFSACWGNG